MAQAQAAQQMSPQQANMLARNIILQNALEMKQIIYSQTLQGVIPGQVVNIPVRNVGLIKRFVVEITCNIQQTAAETLTRTNFGPANMLSQVVFTDLSNQTRINTAGWHLHLLASARRMTAFGAAYTNDSPVNLGSSFGVIKTPASVTTSQSLRMFYELPLAYSDLDLRGAIFGNVVNATMNLALTVNPNFTVASGADPTLAVFQSSTAAVAAPTNFQVTVYQIYLDQLPMGDKGQILPALDLSTAYLLNNSSVIGLAVNTDNPVPYSNFREFLSTIVVYDNNGNLNPGTDINRISLQSANYTNIFQVDPFFSSLETRNELGDDFPPGAYYFNHRKKPISTMQYGNMQLIINPSSVASASGSIFLLGYESMAIINLVTQAGSLYGT